MIVNVDPLIPAGYKVCGIETRDRTSPPLIVDRAIVVFLEKEEPIKDFDWYVNEYLLNNEFTFPKPWIKSYFRNNLYDLIPFEIKIGLLRMVCADLGISVNQMFNYLHVYQIRHCDSSIRIEKICPIPFIHSIMHG